MYKLYKPYPILRGHQTSAIDTYHEAHVKQRAGFKRGLRV